MLATALQSGAGPDIVPSQGPGHAGTMAKAGLLLALDHYADQYGWQEKMLPWALATGYQGDKLYLLPNEMECTIAYYGQNLFNEKGWTPPTNRSEFEAWARKRTGRASSRWRRHRRLRALHQLADHHLLQSPTPDRMRSTRRSPARFPSPTRPSSTRVDPAQRLHATGLDRRRRRTILLHQLRHCAHDACRRRSRFRLGGHLVPLPSEELLRRGGRQRQLLGLGADAGMDRRGYLPHSTRWRSARPSRLPPTATWPIRPRPCSTGTSPTRRVSPSASRPILVS